MTEAQNLVKLMTAVPGRKIKRELAKCVVLALLGGKISVGDLEAIDEEIDNSPYTTSDVNTIVQAVVNGLCGEKVGSMALGFDEDEHIQAGKDHVARAIRVLQAQQKVAGVHAGGGAIPGVAGTDPAARGLPDLSADPNSAPVDEKAASQDPTLADDHRPRVRGKGKNNQD